MHEQLNRWTAQFRSPSTEESFRRFNFDDNLRTNRVAMMLATVFYTAYAFYDYATLSEPLAAVNIRLWAGLICAIATATLFVKSAAKIHDSISTAAIIVMGIGVNLIIYTEPNLDNTYYVAFIQGAVFVCFLLRTNFTNSVLAMLSFLAGIILAVRDKPQSEEAFVQPTILLTMFLISAFGNYLLQRYRRNDFQKTMIIDGQNKRLKVLLEDAQRDNDRKLAAMNLLVHFVKTPLHQINGFSDIVMNSLDRDDGRISFDEGVEGARYIKDATANLSKSVNSLLTYHRLDDLERQREYERVNIGSAFADFADFITDDVEIVKEGKARDIHTVASAVRTALESMAKYYNEADHGASKLKLALSADDEGVTITLRDDGREMSAEDFAETTKPLTKIDNYLTSAGSEMPMLLRTAARAVELCGGAFKRAETANGNAFVLTLPDRPQEVHQDQAAAAA